MAKQKSDCGAAWRLLLAVYCAIMLWLLFGRSNGWDAGIPYQVQLRQNVNLTPFYTIKNYLFVLKHPSSQYMLVHCLFNLTGNILLFLPAGWLFPRVWPRMRNFFLYFAFCAGIMLLIETAQLFTLLGSFDVDDLILNLLGMTVGFTLSNAGRRS